MENGQQIQVDVIVEVIQAVMLELELQEMDNPVYGFHKDVRLVVINVMGLLSIQMGKVYAIALWNQL